MPEKYLNSELAQFFFKIILPAVIGVSVKLAIQMKMEKTKITAINVFLSLLIGVGSAYLVSDLIKHYFEDKEVVAVVAITAILSEKLGQFIIYKVNIDLFITALIDGFFDYILKLRSKK